MFLGHMKSGEASYERAFESCKETLGVEHATSIEIIRCLHRTYIDRGKWTKSEDLFEQVLAGYNGISRSEQPGFSQVSENLEQTRAILRVLGSTRCPIDIELVKIAWFMGESRIMRYIKCSHIRNV